MSTMGRTAGLRCPTCDDSPLMVRDSRGAMRGAVRRRRRCRFCGYTITTYEIAASDLEALKDEATRARRLARLISDIGSGAA